MRRLHCASALIVGVSLAGSVAADATFTIDVADSAGEGFLSNAPPDAASTAGGNNGSTLGAQRLAALQHALDIWGNLLDSEVPIVVEAAVDDLPCTNNSAVLGQGGTSSIFFRVPNAPDPEVWYVSALADRIAGEDLDPMGPDLLIIFNSNLDGSGCLGGASWYYGLDGNAPGSTPDFISVALHEIAHGLGVTSTVDNTSGELAGGRPDSFTQMLYDLTLGDTWDNLSNAERAASAGTPRNLVWLGSNVTAAASSILASGTPLVELSPNVPGFTGAVNEISWAEKPLASVQGEIVQPGNPCQSLSGVNGTVVLGRGNCGGAVQAFRAEQAGAVGILIESQVNVTPPGDLNESGNFDDIDIPAVHISPSDAQALSQAIASQPVTASFSSDGNLVGADAAGRVFMNATNPILTGSSISHFDALTRRQLSAANSFRDLLMEPNSSTQGDAVDLTVELLEDIGWTPSGCGNGVSDDDEECDDGNRISGDGCNQNCELEQCGDGLINGVEECDDGDDNSDSDANACRTDCTLARCGDGVVDSGEECDNGDDNSNSATDACRLDCRPAWCGDDVVDSNEECDDGDDNSDSEPDACRQACEVATCGDGVVDEGELCDPGVDEDCDDDCGVDPSSSEDDDDDNSDDDDDDESGSESNDDEDDDNDSASSDEDAGADNASQGVSVNAEAGCSCRIPTQEGPRPTGLAALGLVLVGLIGRRRRLTRFP